MSADDSQTFGRLWLGVVLLWLWHLWPANNKRTADRLQELERQAARAEAEATAAKKAIALADERLRSMERVMSLLNLAEHERNDKKAWPPTELEMALADGLANILKARQQLAKIEEERDGTARKQ